MKVTHLQRFSVYDGPGIRTTLFCKGCSLRCFWCHNPETIEPEIELWYRKEQCIGCGSCTERTGQPCAEDCPTGALSMTAEWMEQKELTEQLLRDSSHYLRTGGGITFSGGEPLLQAESLRELLVSDKLNGISKAVDTAGNVKWEAFETVLFGTDLFLYDVKCMDSSLHKKGTGAGNELIQENLERLCCTGKAIWIRIPVIPGWNDTVQEMEAMAKRLRELADISGCRIERIQLLPFHRFGREKYQQLGWDYLAENLTPPSEEKMQEFLALFRKRELWITEIGNHLILR